MDDIIVCKYVDRHTGRYFITSWQAENKGDSFCCMWQFTAMNLIARENQPLMLAAVRDEVFFCPPYSTRRRWNAHQ